MTAVAAGSRSWFTPRAVPAATPIPLSAAQRGLWLAQQLNPDAPICEAQYVELHGDLDIALLRKMSYRAAREFASPYLHLIEVDGEPYQLLDLAMDSEIPTIDLRGESDPVAAGMQWMHREYTAPLDLLGGPLIFTAVLMVGERHFLWYSRVHHISLDGYAAMTMLNRVAALYTAAVRGEEAPACQAADLRTLYEADRTYRQSDRFSNDKAYWTQRLADVGEESSLASGSAPARADNLIATVELSTATSQRLERAAEALDASAAAVVVAAFGCYLARMTGRDEVLVNVPVLGRTTALLRRSGGMFVNVVPLPVTIGAADTVVDIVHRVRSDLVGGLRHQRCGLPDIRVAAGYHGQQRFAGPVVNVMLFPQQVRLGSLTGEFHILTSGPVDDLLVDVYRHGIPMRTVVAFLANPDLYTQPQLSRHNTEFLEFLDEFVAATPETHLGRIHPDSVREGIRLRHRRENLMFWRAALADLPMEQPIPVDRPRTAVISNHRTTTTVTVDPGLIAELDGLARRQGTSLFGVIHGALAVLLARLSGSTDISIGTPAVCNGPDGNAIVLRTDINPAESFAGLLHRVEQVDREAFGHADIRFEQILDALALKPSTAHHPLFQVMLAFQNHDPADSNASILDPTDAAPRVDLQVVITERHDHGDVTAAFTYATDLFDAGTIDALMRRWTRILGSVAATPSAPVGTVEILEPAERTDLVSRCGPPPVAPIVLPDLLTSATGRNPDTPAVIFEDRQLTYRELDERSNQLARVLIDRGIGPENVVAVGLPRSPDSVVAIWAITKAGAAFLPVDPTHPADRIAHTVTDSRATTGITTTAQAHHLPPTVHRLELDELDTLGTDTDRIADTDRTAPLHPQHPAYLIYTSGTTGQPKGVTVTHTGLANFVAEHRNRMNFAPGSRTLHLASPSFDVAVQELVVTLAVGATLVIAPGDVYGGNELGELLDRCRINHLFITPSALSTIDPARFPLPDLEHLVVGGEATTTELVEQWSIGRAMFNAYGPTEATVVVTLTPPLTAGETVSAGDPIRGVSEWVLDHWLRPVPVGVAGELYVSGDLLARGYHRRMGLTAGTFVACPWAPGERMYRTGDVVRWVAGGGIQHLGRFDHQVKIRGMRTELDEIDTILAAHDTVGFAATIGYRRSPESSGPDSLVSYVVAAPDRTIDTAIVAEYAAGLLPSYMVPAAIMVLDHIPLTPVGKLDRRALPDPVFADGTVFRAPETPIQQIIAGQFADLLDADRVALDDSFFDLGGNSLIATRVASRLAAALDTDVPVRLLFEAPTVMALASRLAQNVGAGQRLPPLAAQPRPELIPLAPAQQRMWFLNQYDTSSGAYNVPIAIRLLGELNVDALRSAMIDVLDRHESLRTHYPEHNGAPVQQIEPADTVDVDVTPTSVTADNLIAAVTDFAMIGFDATVRAPIRARLFRPGSDTPEHVLAVVVHHIAADGFSMIPLARDVATAYAARIDGHAPAWAPLPIQYADYALWQQAALGSTDDPESLSANQIRYWTDTLNGIVAELPLPVDRPRPMVTSNHGATTTFDWDPELVEALDHVARQQGTSLFMVIHSTLAVLLARLGAGTDIPIGTPVAGRGAATLDNVIGMFVNTLVLRTAIDPTETFIDLLDRVKHVDLEAFGHSDVPFEQLVEVLAPERSQSRHPLFQVMLAFQNLEPVELELPGLTISVVDLPNTVSRFDLHIAMTGDHSGMTAAFTYATDLFDATTIHALAQRWTRILESVTADPERPVGAIEILTPAEHADLVTRSGPPAVAPIVLPDLLVSIAARHRDTPAVVSESGQITYRELDERSNQLARLLTDRGIGPENVVAVVLPRSPESLLAIWAIAKAGAAFLLIDPAYPAERITHMLADSTAGTGITTSNQDRLPPTICRLELDKVAFATIDDAPVADTDRVMPLRPQHPAYLIYTSGTTGRPKGVTITHTGLSGLAAATREHFQLIPASRVLAAASPGFDVSILEWFAAANAGATLILAPESVTAGAELAAVIATRRVTHIAVTPTVLASMDPDGLDSLDTVVLGGEPCPPDLAARWALHHTVVNTYGTTETTIMACAESTPGAIGRAMTVGGPVRGFTALVLDNRLQPAPPGVVGELYLSGPGSARGYHRQPVTTAACFVPNRYGPPGTRLYRTGDLVTWSTDRTLCYRGRSDVQIKIHGHRIEPGDVEAALRSHPDVVNAAVTVHTNPGGVDQLVGYVVPAPDVTLDAGALTGYLLNRLPTHMVPTTIIPLDRIPFTPAGKLDHTALPTPDTRPSQDGTRLPETDLEHTLAQLYAEVLGVDRVGVDDSFFALGGDSIMSIQLVTRAKAAGVVFSARDVFDRKTVAGLAQVAVRDSEAAAIALPAELPGGGVGPVPLTPVMSWMLERGGSFHRLSQWVMLTLPTGIDLVGIVATVREAIDRHDMLRSRLRPEPAAPSGWSLHVEPTAAPADELIRRVSVDADPGSAAFAEIAGAEVDAAAGRLNPTAGIVLQLVWFDCAGSPGRLLIVAHHLVVDRVSWQILISDLAAVWSEISVGRRPQPAPAGTSMRRWAYALHAAADSCDELDWWREVLDAADPPIGSRPLDPTVDVHSTAATVEVTFSSSLTSTVLTTLPRAFHSTVDDALLAGLALAITRWQRRRGCAVTDTLLARESHGRHDSVLPDADITRTVGWFTSAYPVRLDLTDIDIDDVFAAGDAAGVVVKSVKEQLRRVPNHGIGYGLLRYLNADTAPALRALPAPQVNFNYLGRMDALPAVLRDGGWVPAQDGADVGSIQDPDGPLPAVLEINAVVTGTPTSASLTAAWTYPTGVITADEVTGLARLWREAVTSLAEYASKPGTGGLTPSDIDLVHLDQEAIDRLEARYPTLSDIWPLTPLQAGLLFQAEFADTLDPYMVQLRLELSGQVDADRLRHAARTLLDRHPNLRTAFVHNNAGEPVQVVQQDVDVPFTRIDLAEHDDAAVAAELDELFDADRRIRFDMTVAPLLRLTSINISPQHCMLLLSMHHILIDGWSTPLLMRELLSLYVADGDPAVLEPVRRPYRDYLAWLSSQDHDAAETVWARVLDDAVEPTRLASADLGLRHTSIARDLLLELNPSRTAALAAVARHQEVTLNILVQVAWAVVLATMTARDDVVFGTTVSGRPPQIFGIESMIGLFVNTVPVRIRLNYHESLIELLRRVQAEQTSLLDYHFLGLSRIQQVAGPGAMFDTMTVFESYPVERAGLSADTENAGIRVLNAHGNDAAHYPLGVIVHYDTRLHLTFKYLPESFTDHQVRVISDRMRHVLDTIAENADLPLAQLQLLSPAEWTDVMRRSGPPAAPPILLPDLLTRVTAHHPDRPAVVSEDREITYRELDERSNQLARVLIDRGVGPEHVVALGLPRSIDSILAIWAITKAGAAFLPIDPDYPARRIAHMLTDSGAAIGLTHRSHNLPDTIRRLHLDDPTLLAEIAAASTAPAANTDRITPLHPQHPAYLIYTSGTTGQPKGVTITHTGLAGLGAATGRYFHLTSASRVLAAASPSFDVSILEWLSAATTAATLVLAPEAVVAGRELSAVISAHRVTHIAVTPTVLASMNPDGLDSLDTVVTGGETYSPDLAARWASHHSVINTYGATETTIMACSESAPTAASEPATIGRPVHGFTAFVLDHRLQPTPPGVVGELYLSGPGLARGYHGRNATTAACFVSNLYGAPGTRLYRTGDLATWTTDHMLRYQGRNDLRIKIHGHRIEPGDIETALHSHPDVADAAVTVHTSPNGIDQLVAYIVPTPHATPDPSALTTHLLDRLPAYMVPTAITVLDHVPLTPAGKVDRKALPTPDTRPSPAGPPSTPLEATTRDAFARILMLDNAGPDDNFFGLGGNSLTAAALAARLHEWTGHAVPVRWIFTDPTPRSLARRIEDGLDSHDPGAALSVLLPLRTGGTEPPLFCVHPAIGLAWGFSGLVRHLDPDCPVYGLQSPALTDPTTEYDTIRQLAARYVQEIRSVQPTGPYHLLGYSLGGTIAHEIAVQLGGDGTAIATLAMMDTRVVTADGVLRRTPTIGEMLTEFGGVDDTRIPADLTVEAATDLLHSQGGLFIALAPHHLTMLFHDYTRLVDLTRHHRPARFDGDLLYFAATDETNDDASPATAWNRYVTGHIEEHHISTRHERMIDPETLSAVGLVLTKHFHSASAHLDPRTTNKSRS